MTELVDRHGREVHYDPPIEEHPSYRSETPDVEPGDAIEILAYSGTRVDREDGEVVGKTETLSEKALEQSDPPYTMNHWRVVEVEAEYVVAEFGTGFNSRPKRIPKARIVDVDEEKREELEEADRQKQIRADCVEKRKEADLDALMENVVVPHARDAAAEAWPGGTVDVDEIDWFWNPYLTTCAGRAYWGNSVPQTMADSPPAIGLAPAYYYQHGLAELLAVVRHELIHVWQRNHENGFDRGGHGPDFKQWVGDLDTHRHCKAWSKD